jgi:hypothetical protein
MIKNVFALVFVALIGMSGPVRALPIQYTLSQFTGAGGSILNGSITADDLNMDGLIVGTEITAWDFTSVGSIAFSFLSGSGSTVDCADFSAGACFSVGANSLISGGPATGLNNALFYDPISTANVLFQPLDPVSLYVGWTNMSSFDDVTFAHGGQGFQVASATTIPEPSSFALMLIALVMFYAAAARRSATPQFSSVWRQNLQPA